MVQASDTNTANNQTTTKTYASQYDGDGQLTYEATTESSSYVLRSSVTGEDVTRIAVGGQTLKNIVSVDV